MNRVAITSCLAVALLASGAAGQAASAPARSATGVVVFDFACEDGPLGKQLADSVRLRLRRHDGYRVLDRLTTQEASGPLGTDGRDKAAALIGPLGVDIALFGTLSRRGGTLEAKVVCIDPRDAKAGGWVRSFTDSTRRARGVIARNIVERLRGRDEWTPPQYGDEAEPNDFARPLNVNGGFEGSAGWDAVDNVSTFLVDGPPGRGGVLRVRTDLNRDQWLTYRRDLMFGRADANRPPKIERDKSYMSLAGLEGVHFASGWIRATPGKRYWLVADVKGPGSPKIFVKGFRRTPAALDGLPETSLAERGLGVEQFAALSEEQRRKMITEDAASHPMRYVRECYRWYLACKGAGADEGWRHYAAVFPPRGGLGDNVEWLQIQIYTYWKPGEYFFDNVHVYSDPRQAHPAAEAKPRTPNFGKSGGARDDGKVGSE